MPARYCLAHGVMTLHLRTEAGERSLPAALYEHLVGQEALAYAGPRVRRVARWDAAGWDLWWRLLARLSAGRPVLAAIPPASDTPAPPDPAAAYLLPPSIALRAASDLEEGTALYLGAFACEVARFDREGTAEPTLHPPGLEPLYRAVVAEHFRRERRALLPLQVPALLAAGRDLDLAGLLEQLQPLLGDGPAALGGEDAAAVQATAAALRARGRDVQVVDPLDGLERLLWAGGGLP